MIPDLGMADGVEGNCMICFVWDIPRFCLCLAYGCTVFSMLFNCIHNTSFVHCVIVLYNPSALSLKTKDEFCWVGVALSFVFY